MKKSIMFLSVFLLVANSVEAVDHMLPFSAGMTWKCSQGNYDDPGNTWGNYCYFDENGDKEVDRSDGKTDWKYQWSNPTHRVGSNMAYAWDFNFYPTDYGEPLLATADCVVSKVLNKYGGWGNLVQVKYADNTYGWYAHLLNTGEHLLTVAEKQILKQGQLVGYCGGTGGFRVHEHFHVQDEKGNPIRINFIDVWQDNGIPKEGELYTSANHYCSLSDYKVGKFSEGNDGWHLSYNCFTSSDFIARTKSFSLTYYHLKGVDTFGHPISWVKEYHPQDNPFGCPAMDPVWIQDFSATSFSNVNDAPLTSIMVLNPYIWNPRVSYQGVAYPLHGEMLKYWREHFCELGPPASNEFYYDGTEIVVQWFEPYPNNYVAVGFWTKERVFHTSGNLCHQAFDPRFRDEHLYQNIGCPDGKCTGTGGGEPLPDNVLSGDNWSIASYGLYGHVNHETSEPSDQRTEYTNNDGRVASFFKFNNLQNSLRIDWYCRDPNNNIIETKNDTYCADGYSCDGVPAWEYCNLSNITNYGNWKVEVYFNEELVLTKPFTVEINLDKPTNLNLILNNTNNVNLIWNQVELAEKYRIYRNGNMIQETSNLYYTDIGVIPGLSYMYKVVAVRGNRTSSFSDGVSVDIPKTELVVPVIESIVIK